MEKNNITFTREMIEDLKIQYGFDVNIEEKLSHHIEFEMRKERIKNRNKKLEKILTRIND